MSEFLDGDLTSFALCWQVERRDGVAMGFTAHDRDLVVDGFRYRAGPGVTPSSIDNGDPLEADAFEVAGALTSGAISEADLLAGRWDGAEARLWAVDWSDPSQAILLARGEFGAVAIERGGFTVELKGPAAKLDRPVAEETSPMCRAELGDRRCGVDMGGRRLIASIISADHDRVELSVTEPVPNGWAGGRLRWLDGQNAGLTGIIRASGETEVILVEPPPFSPEAGQCVEVTEGCDKRFATCRDRFANAPNFRGEPHLPGIDLLTRYPSE